MLFLASQAHRLLIKQGEPFLSWLYLLSHLYSGLLKRLRFHLASNMKKFRDFLAHKSQPKRQSQHVKTQGLETCNLSLSIEVVTTQRVC